MNQMNDKKKSSSLLILVIAVVLAAGVGYLAYTFLNAEKETIYLFADDYPAGTQISESMLVPTEVNKSMIDDSYAVMGDSNGAYIKPSNIDQINGAFLRTNVAKGTPFISTQTAEFGGPAVETRLAPDMTAVTIPADALSATIMDIDEGARVNIYTSYTFQDENGKEEKVTFSTLQNVKVLAAAREAEENGGGLKGVTVELTPQNAAKVAFGIQYGKIWLGMVKPGEYKEQDIQPYTLDYVIAGMKVVDPSAEGSAAADAEKSAGK